MQSKIRGFMHLDNGQETIPAILADNIKKGDKKVSYYREHTHALASGVSPDAIMAELYGKIDGTCKGTGGSMHIYDQETNFQGGWALVAEQLPYAVGAARSIKLDRERDPEKYKDDDRVAVVFVGEGGAQNGRMQECLNAAAKEDLPLLFLVIDNGRAINTFTPDVATNNDVYLQVHTYRFNGHSPADPEHERGRKDEKQWARKNVDPITIFEEDIRQYSNIASEEELKVIKKEVNKEVKAAMDFAEKSPNPPASLAKELEFPDKPDTDYNTRGPHPEADAVNNRIPKEKLDALEERISMLQQKGKEGSITIGDAINLAILEEMLRDPTTTMHAEDLQAGSSYDIPKLTQQTFGNLRAADEIIDEGHFIGKALGEGLNGYH